MLGRRENPEDRRATLVMITDKGRSLVDELRLLLETFSATITNGLSTSDQQVVRTALQAISANLKAMTTSLQKSHRGKVRPSTASIKAFLHIH